MSTFEDAMATADGEYDKAQATVVLQRQTIENLNADVAAKNAKIVQQEHQIAELEAQLAEGGGGSVPEPPVVEPPTTPTGTKPPAILNDRFKVLDMKRYHLDKTTTDQVKLVSPGKVSFAWAPAPSPLCGADGMRAQMVIRQTYGGGGTPYRDPVGKVRWYGFIFHVDDSFDLTGPESDDKCVVFQWHQGGGSSSFPIKNPPVSAEVMNPGSDGSPDSILRLVISLPQLNLPQPDPDRLNKPLGVVPKKATRFLFRILWSHDSRGQIVAYREDAAGKLQALWTYNGPTCHSQENAGMGLAPFECCYNPGKPAASGKRVLYHGAWLIGSEENTLADMEAALR